MLDLRTLWLTVPEDRYQSTPAMRRAERVLFRLLRVTVEGRGQTETPAFVDLTGPGSRGSARGPDAALRRQPSLARASVS